MGDAAPSLQQLTSKEDPQWKPRLEIAAPDVSVHYCTVTPDFKENHEALFNLSIHISHILLLPLFCKGAILMSLSKLSFLYSVRPLFGRVLRQVPWDVMCS